MSKLDKIFDNDTCLTPDELLAYAERRLSGAEAHRAERHLLDCELCSDALEGILQSGNVKRVPQIVNQLNERIDALAKDQPGQASFFSFQRMAAVLALLIVTGGLWYYISTVNSDEKLFSQYYEPFNKTADSVASSVPAVKEQEPLQAAPVKAERGETQSTKSVAATENKKEKLPVKSLAKESAKNESTSGQTVAMDMPASKAEDVTVQKQVAASRDVSLDEVKATEKTTTEEVVVARSKDTKAVSKTAAPAAAAEMRETEFANVRVDATQLQRAPLQDAIRSYEVKQYEQAFRQAEAFLKKFPKDAEGLFYSGVSALSLEKEKVAAQRLKDCLATGSQQWKEEASWYLSLSYIKLGKSSDAKPLLEFLAGGNSVHAEEARSILEAMH